MTERAWLMALDGTGLFVRCSRAARRAGLTAPDGTPTGALTLFANSLASMVREIRPERLVIAWDSGAPGTTWRRAICPEYKAKRPALPGDLREFAPVRLFCDAAEIAQWCLDDFEADDLLACACRAARDVPGLSVVVCSDDKDVLQLADAGRVYVRGLGKDAQTLDAGLVQDEWGVLPRQLPMLRALAGDQSDGIPGLPGVGPARALAMLARAGFAWPLPEEALPGAEDRARVRAWHDVMTLHGAPRVPEDHDVTGILDIRRSAWTRGNILPVLETYGMRSLAERWSRGLLW